MTTPDPLTELDDVLFDVRHLFRSPGFRRLVLGSIDVELSTFRLLRAVERQTDEPSVGDIATSLGIDQSTASRQIDVAVKAGLLARERCRDDARRSRLRLTPDGRSALTEANRIRRATLGDVVADWPEKDTTELLRLLIELRAGLERVTQ